MGVGNGRLSNQSAGENISTDEIRPEKQQFLSSLLSSCKSPQMKTMVPEVIQQYCDAVLQFAWRFAAMQTNASQATTASCLHVHELFVGVCARWTKSGSAAYP